MEDEPSWKIWEQSREKRFPKTLFAFSRCRIAKTRVPETCSPGRRCTLTIGLSSYGGGATARRGKNPSSIGCVLAWPIGCLYSPDQPTSCRDHDLNRIRTLGLQPFRTLQLDGQETKNCKRRPHSRKARSRISADHSRRCRAPAPFARSSARRLRLPSSATGSTIFRSR